MSSYQTAFSFRANGQQQPALIKIEIQKKKEMKLFKDQSYYKSFI